MSVVWEPRIALTAAEQTVDFPATNDHIVRRREAVEKHAAGAARTLALAIFELEILAPRTLIDRLALRLQRALDATMRFGFTEARREIAELRLFSPRPVHAAVSVPDDAGAYGYLAAQGENGIREFIRIRSIQASRAIAADVIEAAKTPGLTAAEREALLLDRARRALHNSSLALVGETLNMGRTAGAMSLAHPPEFAMRSEQLDRRTCDPCSRLHGEIALVGSPEYFDLLPPTGCLGGGRCRGIMVFGAGPLDFRTAPLPGPEPSPPPALVPDLPPAVIYSDSVREHLRFPSRTIHTETRAALDEAADAIDQVVKLPRSLAEPALPVRIQHLPNAHGRYRQNADTFEPVDITISPGAASPVRTLVHETGHYIDTRHLVGANGEDVSLLGRGDIPDAVRAAMERFLRVARESRRNQELETLGSDRIAGYYRAPYEVWARAFEQLVTLRIGGRMRQELDEELARSRRDRELSRFSAVYPKQWEWDDFEAVREAIEDVLRAAGLLR